MTHPKNSVDVTTLDATLVKGLTDPIVLEQQGQPIAVLISLADYEIYQTLRKQQPHISKDEARCLANQVVFDDLVGCALSSGQPTWQMMPTPRWQIPYHTFNGHLLKMIDVDAVTGEVFLTTEERSHLLNAVERSLETDAPYPFTPPFTNQPPSTTIVSPVI